MSLLLVWSWLLRPYDEERQCTQQWDQQDDDDPQNERGIVQLAAAQARQGHDGQHEPSCQDKKVYDLECPYCPVNSNHSHTSGDKSAKERLSSLASLTCGSDATCSCVALFMRGLLWSGHLHRVWRLPVAPAGFAGVLLAQKIYSSKKLQQAQQISKSGPGKYLNAILALVCSGFVAHFCIRIFAQDVRMTDNYLGSVVAQPAVGQLVFAVLLSFGCAAFVAKKFFNVSYIWPSIASAFVTALIISSYARFSPHLFENWPTAFFPNSVASVLPVQMVAFGTIGSIAGYWMAIRYDYWRKHEIK